jgi:UDP-2,4-diacetamido-2,4,6-trideoxy-beta-L-altropyranose hydrolase
MYRRPDVKEHRFVFRLDANAIIGIGHLRRCLILANELQKMNGVSHFICRERFGAELERLLAPHALHWLGSSTDEIHDADAALRIIGDLPSSPDWVILDSYSLAQPWETQVRRAGHKIAVIEDNRTRMHCADLLISDSAAPFNSSYNSVAGARALTGSAYAIVDPIYEYSAAKKPPIGPKRILISYGGADPTDETPKAIAAIRALKGGRANSIGVVDVVMGPVNSRATGVSAAAAGIPGVMVHQAVPSLAPLMRQADLVLTAGGISMIEALSLRKPCIVTVTGEQQSAMVAELERRGVICSLGQHEAIGSRDVQKMLASVLDDFAPFAAHVAANLVFDHLGASRVAAVMIGAAVP